MKTLTPSSHPSVALNLRYVTDTEPGYCRTYTKGKFTYLSKNKPIKNKNTLKRIASLVIPPAWENVWICKFKNGHIQATGIDKRGRKQYIYHLDWSTIRNVKKFDRLLGFANKMKLLRTQLRKDLRKKKLSKEKVCAIAISTMNATYIRAGNKSYEHNYGSYGLTTLKNRHVKIDKNEIFFKFKGKKGVLQQVYIKEAKIAKMLKNVKEIPGQELFQYYDHDGAIQRLDSGDLNRYLKQAMQEDYTCKDFRTWAGCTLAFMMMANEPYGELISERKKVMVTILDHVAKQLGNTRSVTRNYYIHPELQKQYVEGDLKNELLKLKRKMVQNTDGATEKALLKFIRSRCEK